MPQYIAFLRAINVGGRNIKMAELRDHFTALKFKNIESFIASGNVIFNTPEADTTVLSQKIEAHLLSVLGYEVKTFIRTPKQVTDIINHPAFDAANIEAASAFSVGLLAQPLTQQQCEALQQLENDIDQFHTHGCEVYWCCAVKQSDSKFSNVAFEKRLQLNATFRGINTLKRLATKYPSSQ